MKQRVLAAIISTALFCPVAPGMSDLSSGAAQAASEKILSLTLDGDLWGPAEVVLSKRGVRVRSRIGMSFWFPEKPAVVYLLNPENQTYYAQPTAEFLEDMHEDYRPLKYSRLSRRAKTLSDGTKSEIITAFYSAPNKKEEIVAEITSLKNTDLPPAVHRMWCTYLGVPEKGFGLPIGEFQSVRRIRHFREAVNGGGRQRWLCIALPKKVITKTMDEKLLKLPTNYRQAKDKASLYLSTDGNLQEKDLEDFFISTPSKRSNTPQK